MSAQGLMTDEIGLTRCSWAASTSEYRAYHDTEWGVPVHGETGLYERLTLEAFQSGLSWLTILRKRESFRAAFAGFDVLKDRQQKRRGFSRSGFGLAHHILAGQNDRNRLGLDGGHGLVAHFGYGACQRLGQR